MALNRLGVASVLMGSLVLSACTRDNEAPVEGADQTPPVAAPATATRAISFTCESGQAVSVSYPDEATASVTYRGSTYAMRLLPSGSGARYSGSGFEWWVTTRGGQEVATFGREGPTAEIGVDVIERCNRPPATPPTPVVVMAPPPPGGASASAPCRSAQLRLASESGDAGAGNRANVFSVANTGAAPCTVAGYPSVRLLDAQRAPLSTIRSDQNPNTASPVSIPAGGKAFFDIAWNVVPHEGAGERVCPAAATVSVALHVDPAALTTPLSLTPCGGRIRVNPFRASAEPAPAPAPAAASAPST